MQYYSAKPASPEHAQELVELLAQCVPAVSPQTVWQVPWTYQNYQVVCDAYGKVIGAGSLQRSHGNKLEIRGLVVAPSHRGCRIATSIVKALLAIAKKQNCEVVCVTRNPEFFGEMGFVPTTALWLAPDCRWRRRSPHDKKETVGSRIAMKYTTTRQNTETSGRKYYGNYTEQRRCQTSAEQ